MVGLVNSAKEFAVIPHDTLFISEGFMNSFLTLWIAYLFQGAYFSGNYGSQLLSTWAHLSFALIFFLICIYIYIFNAQHIKKDFLSLLNA